MPKAISKNKKKSWNKFSDITDVEEYFESKRQEERIGGPFDDRPDGDLFFIQKTTRDSIPVTYPRGKKPLRCHQALESYSKVAPPVKSTSGVIGRKRKIVLLNKVKKESEKLANLQEKKRKLRKVEQAVPGNKFPDVWNKAAVTEVDQEIEDLISYRDEILKKKSPKVPTHRYQKSSLLPPVEVPHPGTSYQPSFEDHQELLRKAVLVEEKKEKAIRHIKRVLLDYFPKEGMKSLEQAYMKEMSEGLFDKPASDKNEEDKANESYMEMGNPPVRADDRKTRSKRRKFKEMKQEERLRLERKLEKERLDKVYRLKKLKAELKQMEIQTQERQKARVQKKVDRLYQPHTLGSIKYEPLDIEVNLTEELSGSLRTMKTEGNIMEDRFNSLQRRNIIEPRVKQKFQRKYKLKLQVKRSHRNFV